MSTSDLFDDVLIHMSLLMDYISYVYNAFLSILFLKFLHQEPLQVHTPTETYHPAVLITGTSSGIGRNTALELANRGYTVFATVRKEDDANELKEIFKGYENSKQGSLIPILMDVTKKQDIQDAHKIVREKIGREIPFVGLINNAALAMHLPLEIASEEFLMDSFSTNFFGVINLTKKFLPLLRESRGRVINIGSVGAWETLPSMGVYDSTKAALRTMTRAWRLESRPNGVHFSLIEPGKKRILFNKKTIMTRIIKTPLTERAVENYRNFTSFPSNSSYHDLRHSITSSVIGSYENMYRMVGKWCTNSLFKGSPPDVVTDAIVHALSAQYPKNTYYVGFDARMASTLNWLVGDRIIEVVLAKALTPSENIHM
ncbi:18351_t:CDS:2 [Acaulospora morrowiae]|uniref:18351_t:CDS:1 n=1 Tax=Acaulospora morrowiae TaxID=94023 RepID=A0A9N8ZQR3_9GLOM|nr:18351_t:CDS:2 [Acaulospora morrowiae]